MVITKSVKTNKVVKLWLQVLFYSIVIFLVFIAIGRETFEIKEFIKSIAPITFSQWWFASSYFMLYLLTPYINIFLKSLDQKQYISFIALIAICWCIVPTFTGRPFESNRLLWFVFVYSLAGYLRLFGFKTKLSGKKLIVLSVICVLITFALVLIFDILGKTKAFFAHNATFFYGMQKLPILIISILMFFGFLKLKIKYNKLINVVASASFGIYLIHDHDYVRRFLWETLFKNASFSKSYKLIPYSMFVIIMVFVICACIELLRIYLIEKNSGLVINKISNLIDKVKSLIIPDKI